MLILRQGRLSTLTGSWDRPNREHGAGTVTGLPGPRV